MTDRPEDPQDRGEQVARRGDEAAGPEDLQDTWNTPRQSWDREQTPVDALGHIGDDEINEDQIGREPRRSGI